MSETRVKRRAKSKRGRLATTIDAEILQKLRGFAEQEGVSLSLALEAMIESYLSKPGRKVL